MNQPLAHTELIAAFKRAEAEAAHKFGLIKAVAKKLADLGVVLKD